MPYINMKISVEKFQQLHQVAISGMDEMDKAIAFVQIFSNKSIDEIEKMKLNKFNKLCRKANFYFGKALDKVVNGKPSRYFWVGMKPFYINYDIAKLPAGKYVETIYFGDDIVPNLHKIMASLVYELKFTWKGFKIKPYDGSKHDEISELMLKADFKKCYDIAVFFYLVLRHSIIDLKDYLIKESKDPEMAEKALTDFKKITDGFVMPKWYQNSKELV